MSYSRDDWHHVTQVTASGRSIDMDVDRLGRVLSVSYPDGGSESFDYNARSVPLSHTDRGGRTTHFSYNPGNHLTQVSRGGIDLLTIDYEDQMQVVAINDALDRSVESYVLDSQYRPVSIQNVLGQSMSISYTVGGYTDAITRFDGTQVSMSYNNNGLPTSVVYPGQTYTFGYTAARRLTSAANALGSVGISHNAAGQPVSVGNPGTASATSYSYDGGGLPSGYINAAGAWTNSYADWRLESVSGPHGDFGFDHDPHDQIEEVDFPGGIVLNFTHDAIGRVTGMRWTDSGNNTLKEFQYAYDGYDRISSITNETGGWIDYTYDDNLDWLLTKTVRDSTGTAVRSYAYTFDNVGNRLSDSANGVTNTYSVTTGDRLAGIDYNTAGCVTGIRDLTLDWNGGYQLVEAARGGVTNSYQYDALGRLASISDGQQTAWLVYEGAHVSAETDQSGNVLRSYTHGPGIDWIMSMRTCDGGQTNLYIYLTDHVGTVHALVDAATGDIVESYTYDAFGVVSAFDGAGNPISASQVGNSYLFHGRRYDWDTGLYHFRARWYDPVTGRWLSNDPIGIAGGLNQYVAFGNNPVIYVDPWGEEITLAGVGLFFAGKYLKYKAIPVVVAGSKWVGTQGRDLFVRAKPIYESGQVHLGNVMQWFHFETGFWPAAARTGAGAFVPGTGAYLSGPSKIQHDAGGIARSALEAAWRIYRSSSPRRHYREPRDEVYPWSAGNANVWHQADFVMSDEK